MGPALVAVGEGLLIGARFLGAAAMRYAIRPAMSYLGGSTPRWVSWGLTAVNVGAPLLFNKVENGSGGAITQRMIEDAVDGIKEGIKAGRITKETLEDGVVAAMSIADMRSSADTMGHTAAVMGAIGNTTNPTPEALQRGKVASISWIVTHPVMPMVRFMLRAAAAEDLHSNQAEREHYIAQGFVNDLISAARIAPLEKHNAAVTEADIKAVLREQKQKGHLDELFKVCPALERGLNDLYPDLFDAPAPVVKETPESIAAPTTPTAPTTPEKAVVPPAPVVTMPVVSAPVVSDKGKGRENNTETKPEGSGQVNWLSVDPGKLKGFDLTTAFDKVADAAGKVDRWDMKLLSTLMEVAKGVSPLFNMLGMQETGDRFMRFSLGLAQHAMKSQFGDKFDIAMVPKPGFVPALAP